MLPSVVHPALLWALPLIGVPVLIHLINMMRHRRVKWAAMEFLLVSQKRHRTWIVFKQLLLLLLRMAAIAAIVFMVAQPLLRDRFGAMFGGSKTHHVVLLDDSYSMTDRWGNTSAFDQAKQVVSRLAGQAGRQDTAQVFTLLRFSRASRLARGTDPDLLNQSLDAGFPALLEKTLGGLNPSETDAGPLEALEAVDRLGSQKEDESRVIYLVSDFRANQWDDPSVLQNTLARLNASGAQLQFVNCVDAVRPNLTLSSLRASGGTRAAGVPLLIDVSVTNYGSTRARQVSVLLEEDGVSRPAVELEEISAGKTLTRRFPVLFPTAGEHRIKAQLQSDAVATDNVRYLVIDFPSTAPVLIIDGDPQAQDARFLAAALAPEGKIKTGLSPVLESPRFLRTADLSKYESILLANLDRIEPAEVEALEKYARAGGGVAFFMGERSRSEYFNKILYRQGQGLFPLPLAGATELLVNRLEKTPDLEVGDHPIFSVFAGERNSFIHTVLIERYFAAAKNWQPPADSTVKVIARLRNKAPLVVEQKFGAGRVVVFLTKAAPVQTLSGAWNNWGKNNPSYVVAMLELQSYLAAPRHADPARLVGSPLNVSAPAEQYQPEVRFITPQEKAGGALSVAAVKSSSSEAAGFLDTDYSGFYEAQLVSVQGGEQSRHFAINVTPQEGDLARLDGEQLAARLPDIRYTYHQAQDLRYEARQHAGANLGDSLMFLALAVLVGEQLLAYSASYHPAKRGGR